MIETVAIIHNQLNVGVYRLLADYFRFCGINVFNYSVTEDTKMEWRYEFDAVFIDETDSVHPFELSQRHFLKEIFQDRICFWLEKDNSKWNYMEPGEHDRRVDFLRSVICMLDEKSLLESEDVKVLTFLAEKYVEHDIMKNRIVLQTFLPLPGCICATREKFVDAYIDILKCDDKDRWQEHFYYWFARRYLELSINECYDFLDEDLLLSTSKLVEHIEEKIQVLSKQKSQALLYSTIARFYECDFFDDRKSIEYMQEAKKLSDGSAFEYVFSYSLGRYYEKYYGWNEAICFYDKSLSLAPDEYRALYKVAMYYWKEKKDVEKACKYLKRIDDILENRFIHNLLQPRDAEYLYRTWLSIYEITNESGVRVLNGITAEDATRRMSDILARAEDVNHTNPIYALIFGSDAQIDDKYSRDGIKVDARIKLAERLKIFQ